MHIELAQQVFEIVLQNNSIYTQFCIKQGKIELKAKFHEANFNNIQFYLRWRRHLKLVEDSLSGILNYLQQINNLEEFLNTFSIE